MSSMAAPSTSALREWTTTRSSCRSQWPTSRTIPLDPWDDSPAPSFDWFYQGFNRTVAHPAGHRRGLSPAFTIPAAFDLTPIAVWPSELVNAAWGRRPAGHRHCRHQLHHGAGNRRGEKRRFLRHAVDGRRFLDVPQRSPLVWRFPGRAQERGLPPAHSARRICHRSGSGHTAHSAGNAVHSWRNGRGHHAHLGSRLLRLRCRRHSHPHRPERADAARRC